MSSRSLLYDGPRTRIEMRPQCFLTCDHPCQHDPEECRSLWSLFLHYCSYGALAADIKRRKERNDPIALPTFHTRPEGWAREKFISYWKVYEIELNATTQWERFKVISDAFLHGWFTTVKEWPYNEENPRDPHRYMLTEWGFEQVDVLGFNQELERLRQRFETRVRQEGYLYFTAAVNCFYGQDHSQALMNTQQTEEAHSFRTKYEKAHMFAIRARELQRSDV